MAGAMSRPDILIVSLAATAGLREADDELAASLRRAGATVAVARVARQRDLPTMALHELGWARAARAAASAHDAGVVLYSSVTAALLWPRPGAIRFDSPAAASRPGRHGLWQRPVERRRFSQAKLLVPWSEQALAEGPSPHAEAIVVPVPIEPSGPAEPQRDIAAITYAADPEKKGLERVLAAWRTARREGEELVVAGLAGGPAAPGVRYAGLLGRDDYRALLRRARVFVTAPRREDHGLAQLEALADGCLLVTTAAPGPYVALPLARALDGRLVGDDLARALRIALDEPRAGYAEEAQGLLQSSSRRRVDELVSTQLLPALLA
jgi:glycosyltransferase involved in cell wall biosynthesis